MATPTGELERTMPNPSRLRDSTQIILPSRTLCGLREEIEAEFTLTIIDEPDEQIRLIGSPAEIKRVNDFLTRHGVGIL